MKFIGFLFDVGHTGLFHDPDENLFCKYNPDGSAVLHHMVFLFPHPYESLAFNGEEIKIPVPTAPGLYSMWVILDYWSDPDENLGCE